MTPILKIAIPALVIGVIAELSCKKEYSCENCGDTNKPPVANAGQNQAIILPTDSATLDGSGSSDVDGGISNYQWAKVSGPVSSHIITITSPVTIVKRLTAGVYQFELKVTDNSGLSARDTVQIMITDPVQINQPPVANAGRDQTITLPNNTVTLDGSGSTDPDNNIIGYAWSKISGPVAFKITNANAIQTQVVNLEQGIYQFELAVTDADGLISKDTMFVNVVKNTFNGQEFIFESLTWEIGDFYGIGAEDVYTGTPARPDLFQNAPGLSYNTQLQGEIYLKFDTASAWIQVVSRDLFNHNLPGQYQYVYDIISPFLYVHVYPLDYQLIGKKVSLKVRFL